MIALVTFVALYFIYDADPTNIPNQAERLRQAGLKSTSKSTKSTFEKAKIFIRSLIKIMMDRNYVFVRQRSKFDTIGENPREGISLVIVEKSVVRYVNNNRWLPSPASGNNNSPIVGSIQCKQTGWNYINDRAFYKNYFADSWWSSCR